MKIRIYRLQVDHAPKHYLVDFKYAHILGRYSWKYVPRLNRARAVIKRKRPRMMLHKFIIKLAGLKWVEVYFANGDPFDCRVGNLLPYRREEEGAKRRMFKGKRVRYKGVFFKAATRKYGAAIRVRKKYKHLGYFDTAELAAEAYRRAFELAHPV